MGQTILVSGLTTSDLTLYDHGSRKCSFLSPAKRNLTGKSGFVVLFLIMIMSGIKLSGQTNYYSKSSGNLELLSTWGQNPDGSGSAPANFSDNNQIFNVRNNATPAIGADWTVSGAGSQIILGDGINPCLFDINSTYSVAGPLEIRNNATLRITSSAATPYSGTLSVLDGGSYEHQLNGGIIPAATWGNNSSLRITISANSAVDGFNQSFGNVILACGTSTITLNQSPVIKGTLTLSSGTVNYGANNITVNGNIVNNGTFSGGGKIILTGGGAAHSVTGGTSTFGNLELDDVNGANISGTGSTSISGDLVVSSGSLNAGAFTTSFAVAGTTTVGTGPGTGQLVISSSTGSKTFTGLVTIGANGTWSNTANTAVTFQGGITNNGTFTAGTGTQTFNTNDQILTGTLSIPTLTVTGINLTNNNTLTVGAALSGTGTLIQAAGSVLNLGGTSAITNIDADVNSNTVNYTAGNQTVKGITYHNLGLAGTNNKTLGAAVTVNGNLDVTGTTTVVDAGFQITGNASGTFSMGAGTGLTLGNAATATQFPLSFTAPNTSLNAASTVTYNSNLVQTVSSLPSYGNLTVNSAAAAVKNLDGNTVVAGNLTVSANNTLEDNNYSLSVTGNITINGTHNGTGKIVASGGNLQNVSGTGSLRNFEISKSANTARLTGPVTVNGDVSVTTGTFSLNGNNLVTGGNINISGGATLTINSNSVLRVSPGKTITNAGTFSLSGAAGTPAVITRNVAGTYSYVQNAATGVFTATYFSFEYGNATISNGSVTALNNGIFSYGTGLNEYLNLDGFGTNINASLLTFNAGPVYNIRKTAGAGIITVAGASGALAGEAFDQDNGDPGTLINWTSGNTYYSQNSGNFSNLANWNTIIGGGGASPVAADLTSGLSTFIIQAGHNVTLNQTVDANSITVNGTLTTGNDVTARTLTIRNDLTISNTGTVNVGAFNAIHTLNIYKNLIVNGTIDLYNSATQACNLTITSAGDPDHNIIGTPVSSQFGNITLAANSNKTTAGFSLNIAGNVTLSAGSEFNGGTLTHNVAGNWTGNATGNHTGNDRIVFNGAAQTLTGPTTFYDAELSGTAVKSFLQQITINNDLIAAAGAPIVIGGAANTTTVNRNFMVTNNTPLTLGSAAAAKTINITGNIQVDAGSSFAVGAFAAAHSLSIGGNLIANGDFNMVQAPGNVCNVTFTGATDNTVTGTAATCNFNRITINKGVTSVNTLDVQRVITMASPLAAGTNLIVSNGTFKLSSASSIYPYFGSQVISAATGRLWINNAGAVIGDVLNQGLTATITGTLQVDAGTFRWGGQANSYIETNSATSTINLTSASSSILVNGGLYLRGGAKFSMTDGTILLDAQSSAAYNPGYNILNITNNVSNNISITGGTITIPDPHAVAGGGVAVSIITTDGTYNFDGSTIRIGDGLSTSAGSAEGFDISLGTNVPLGNIIINNTVTNAATRFVRLTGNSSIRGNLTLSASGGSELRISTFTLNLMKDLLNSGTITGTTGNITFTGGTASHKITSSALPNVILNDANGAELQTAATLNGTLTLTSGVLKLGDNDLTLANTTAIAGSPFSSSKMVETNGTGRLIRSANATNASFNLLYPVGSGGYYNPLNVTGLTGAVAAARTFSVRAVPVNPAVLANSINKYWEISTTNITAGPQLLSLTYNAGEVVGDPLLFQPFTNASGSWGVATGPSVPGSNPATSTGAPVINGLWTVGSPSTFYSYQTGAWDQASTWTFDPGGTTGPGSSIPGQNDKVVILSGRTVSLSANVFTQNLDITINNGGILDLGARRFTNSLAALRGDGVLKLASGFFPTAMVNTFVTTDGGTTEYNNSGSMSATQAVYYHLVIRSAGAVSTVNDITLNGNLHVRQGAFEINDVIDSRLKLIIRGDVIVDAPGTIRINPADTRSDLGPMPSIDGSTGGYLNYYENNSHRIEIYGNLTNNGTVKFSNLNYPVYNQFPDDGFATVYFRGPADNTITANGQTDFYNLIVDKGTDQTFKLNLYSAAYSKFRLFGANTAYANPTASPGNPDIKKALWIKNGSLVLQGLTVIPSLSEGASPASMPAHLSSDYFIPANGALILDGPGVIVLGTADSYTEVDAAYGLAGGSNVLYGINASGGNSGFSLLGKLQVNDGYLSTRESSGLNYYSYSSAQFILNGGIVDTKQFHDPEGGGLISYVQGGGEMILRGQFTNVISYAAPADLANATVSNTRTANGIDQAGAATLQLSGNAANGFTMSGGDIKIYDACNSLASPLAIQIACPGANVNVTGGTVTFLRDADYLVSSTGPFYNVTLDRADFNSTLQFGSNLTVLNDLLVNSGELSAIPGNYNLTVGGDFLLAAGTNYIPGTNTTLFNGALAQTFTTDIGGPVALYNFNITKPAGIALDLAGTQKTFNVANNFRLTAGTLNDGGAVINISGNIFNSGVHSGTGKLALIGTNLQTIDGNGIFGSIDLANTNAAPAPVSLLAGITINGVMNFTNNKSLNIGIHNVRLNSAATLLNTSASAYLRSAGNAGDGGLTKVYSASTTSFEFPVGVTDYTPAELIVNGTPAAYGSITVVPVNYEHPNVTVAGRSLTYFWRTESSGFNLAGGSVTHKYVYADADITTGADITENEYVGARFNAPSTWSKFPVSAVNAGTNTIGGAGSGGFLENSSVIDGDYTAGDDNPLNPFGMPAIYYSRQTGLWKDGNTWSFSDHSGVQPPAGSWPGASDIVIIGNGHTINLYNDPNYALNTATVSCATLQIEAGSTLDIGNNPGSVFSMVQSHPNGNGTFRLTATEPVAGAPTYNISTFVFPAGDFSDFNVNLGTTEFYTTKQDGTSLYILPPISYVGNMVLSPLGIPVVGDNMVLQNVSSLTVYGDLTLNGASNASAIGLSWNTNNVYYGFSAFYPTVEKTVTVKGDLNINGGSLTYFDDVVPQHLVVEGDINISNVTNGASIIAWDSNNGWIPFNNGPSGIVNTLTVGGNINNNGTAVSIFNGLNLFWNDATPHFVDVRFTGSSNASLTGSGAYNFRNVTVDKGTSQATTLTVSSTGTFQTPVNDWLSLVNGTFIYSRPGNFNISTTTPFIIPPTAGLTLNTANNVFISNASTNTSDLMLNGKLTVINGTVYVGPVTSTVFNNDIEYSVGGSSAIDVQGGSLIVNGQVRRNPSAAGGILKYSQSGGSVVIRGQNQNTTNAKLEVVNAGSSFDMSNGTLTIMRGNGATLTPSSPFGDLYLRPASGAVTGGTILFSQNGMAPAPVTPQNYFLDATIPLNNLTVTGVSAANYAAVRLLMSPLTVNGNMTISANSSLLANGINATFNGNFTSPGVAGYISGNNLTTFSSPNASPFGGVQTLTGATNFYDLAVSPGTSFTISNPVTVNGNLSITSGTFNLGANPVTLLGDILNNTSYLDNNAVGTGILLNGTAKQHISGTGAFSRLTLNNAAGAEIENNITVQEDITMTLGVLDIKKYLLTMGTGSNLQGAPFNALKMITSDGVFSNVGIRKFFNPGPQTFYYPIGTANKFTPALLTITNNATVGFVRINNISSRHPAVKDPANSLDYYWEVQSSGISSFEGNLVLNYLQSDVDGDEPNFRAARLVIPGSTWSLEVDGVDETNNTLTTVYSGAATATNISGEYTAGITTAFFNNVPEYTTKMAGDWTDETIWEQTGGDPYPCPPDGPDGFIVHINHEVTLDKNYCYAYRTTINNKLNVVAPFYGHNLGTVDGNGTLYLESGSFPAGVYTAFMDCANNATVEFGGTGTYTIIADLYDRIANLKVSGTGVRVLPNLDLVICNQLTIDGPVLDNSVYNKKLTIQGSMVHLSGSFSAGTGAGATVAFAGTAAQTLGGTVMGNFTGASSFNNLEINNAAGLRINDDGDIEVSGNLILTNGLINTGSNRKLTITNSAINSVIPAGGSITSFVDGPLTKRISQFDNFLFPVGINKAGFNVLGNKLRISSTQTGPELWTVNYNNPNPTNLSFTSPLLGVSAMEYFTVQTAAGRRAKVNINWTPSSDVNPIVTGGIANIRVASYDGASWLGLPTTSAGDNNNGTASTTGIVTFTSDDSFTLGSITTLIPRAQFNPTGPVCGDDGIPVSFTAPGPIPTDYVLTYTLNAGAPIVVNITELDLPYDLPTPLPGEYKLISFKYDNGLSTGVVDATPIMVYPDPTPASAGPDQIRCGITTTLLEGNTAVVGTGKWTIESGTGGTVMTPSSPASQFIGLNGNSYVLKWTISSGTCVSEDLVQVSFTILPAAPTAAASQSFCGSATVANLVATPPPPGTVDWYDAPTGGTLLAAALPLVTGTTYYAETNAGCVSLTRTPVTVTIVPVPVAPTLLSSAPVAGSQVCAGYNTGSATFSAGSGEGADQYEYSINGGSTWLPYVSGAAIPTAGATGSVQVRGRRSGGPVCPPSAYNTYILWNISTVPVAPTLASATPPSTSIVCKGYNTGVVTGVAGSGGSTGASDVYELSIDGGSTWSVYASGSPIVTSLATGDVIVRAMRTGGSYGCSDTPWSILSTWTLGTDPVSPDFAIVTPAAGTSICAGFNGPSSTFTAGSGGSSGAADTYEYSIDNGLTWSGYAPGSSINTTGAVTNVIIRISRSGGNFGCTGTVPRTIVWPVTSAPVAPVLGSATPASGSIVCAGFNTGTVSGTAGSGGSAGAADEYQVSIDGGATYNPYISGNAIITTGATGNIIVQARRTGGSFGCTATAWNTIATWTLASAVINPSLSSATPVIGTPVCANFIGPLANIIAGSGGSSGASDIYEYSINNGTSWTSYVSGTQINTVGATGNVLVRVSRTGGSYGCTGTAPVTIATWPVAGPPVAPLLASSNPVDGSTICAGFNTGIVNGAPGSGGSGGAVDEYRVSKDGGLTWIPYISGTAINTDAATGSVIVQSRRTGGSYGCTDTPWGTINTWIVGVTPAVPGVITGTAAQCPSLAGQTYSIAAVAGATTYNWTVPAGWTITAGAGTTSITVTTGSTGDNGNITVTAQNSCGTSAAQTLAVTVIAAPTVTFVTEPGATACSGDDLVYTTQAGQVNYIWTIPGTSGTDYNIISGGSATDNTITLEWLTAGIKTITSSYSSISGCNAIPGTSNPTIVSAVPSPTISGPSSVCLNSAGNTYTTETGMTGYSWIVTGGIITAGGGAADNSITITWNSAGNQTISLTYTNGSCTPAIPTVKNITVNQLPVPVITGPALSCLNSVGNVYTTAAGMTGYVWVVTGGSVTAGGNPTDNTITVTWTATGTQSVSVSYTDANNCSPSAATSYNVNVGASLTVNPVITPALCAGGTGNIVVSAAGGTAPYVFRIDGGSFQSSGTFSNVSTGTHTITAQDANLCNVTTSVNVTQPAAVVATIASQGNVRCQGGADGTVSVTATGGTAPYQFSINGGTFQASGNFTGLAAGSHNIVVRDANLCSANISATLTEPVALAIAETHADVICPDAEEGSIHLTVTGGTGPYTILWGDDNTATTADRLDITDGDYRAVVTDQNGCSAAIDITVGVIGSEDCLAIPEIITPNGDGYNDVWRIKNIDMFPNAEVIIFNRWGKRVFQTKNLLDNPWDGTLKGDLLPTDSYHYILDLHNGTKPKSGVISIIK